ncbi:hypothetical protein ACMGT0_20230 [Pseudomonas sp. RHF3.3-3]|uniref:hypothetical protein n=1 Tax=Pseudomonas TaxID=286 RepID=UPI00128F5D8F|nr:hypothetical protein [Pseudomonas fuscovaginae]
MDKCARSKLFSPLLLTAAIFLCGSKAFGSCDFYFDSGPKVVFNGAGAECKKARFNGAVLTFYVNYPGGEVLSGRAIDGSVVVDRVRKISSDLVRGDVSIKYMSLASSVDGVEFYEAGDRKLFRFKGVDGQRVYVGGGDVSEGNRAFQGLEILYQFSKGYVNFKVIDDFVLGVLTSRVAIGN